MKDLNKIEEMLQEFIKNVNIDNADLEILLEEIDLEDLGNTLYYDQEEAEGMTIDDDDHALMTTDDFGPEYLEYFSEKQKETLTSMTESDFTTLIRKSYEAMSDRAMTPAQEMQLKNMYSAAVKSEKDKHKSQ